MPDPEAVSQDARGTVQESSQALIFAYGFGFDHPTNEVCDLALVKNLRYLETPSGFAELEAIAAQYDQGDWMHEEVESGYSLACALPRYSNQNELR